MSDNTDLIATLDERRAEIIARHNNGLGKSAGTIRQVVQAIDHPNSYYVSLTAAERDHVRGEWRTLARELGVRLSTRHRQPKTVGQPITASTGARTPTVGCSNADPNCGQDAEGSPSLEQFMVKRLPRRPYCSNDKTARNIRSVSDALEYAYIQPNPPGLTYWLVFDIDRPDAKSLGDWATVLTPNIVVANPQNGHAHYYYCLDQPVCTTANGKPGPQRYLRAVYDALAVLLGCDVGYTRLIAKNPLHPAHLTLWLRGAPYTLGELAEHLDLESGKAWRHARRARRDAVNDGGRNCSLFDELRRWAYDWVAEYRDAADETAWRAACLRQADAMNAFPGHLEGDLPWSEVKSVAKSVATWTWRHFGNTRGQDCRFSAKQAARGRRKGAKARDKLLPQALTMHAEGASNKAIARALGVTAPTIANWLKRVARI